MIDNPHSKRIKFLASLTRKKNRKEAGLFLVEGPQAVTELLTHRPDLADSIYVAFDGAGFLDIERRADGHGVPVHHATTPVMRALSDTVNPQGVVAVAKIETVSLAAAVKNAQLVALLHEIRDPGNAGTVLRAADAAGATAVIFAGDSIDPFNPKVVRSTTGSIFHLPIVTDVSVQESVIALRQHGVRVLAADVGGQDVSPGSKHLQGPHAWLFGNEARGLPAQFKELADHTLRLPIFGAAESLNLATAASVCFYLSAFALRDND